MTFLKRLRGPMMQGAVFAAVLIASACKPPQGEVSRTAYIIGEDDIQELTSEEAAKVDKKVRDSSVLLATRLASGKIKFCSGSVLSPAIASTAGLAGSASGSWVLSNHHCFSKQDKKGLATSELLPEACTATDIYFGFSSENEFKATKVPCQAGSLRTDFEGDLSLFELASEPPESAKGLDFWEGEDTELRDREVYIVHYPNVAGRTRAPEGSASQLPTASVTTNNCKTVQPFERRVWHLDGALPFSLRHTCDLISGSSGSALIDRASGSILGINWGGVKFSEALANRVDNAATMPPYAKAFLAQNLDVYKKEAISRNTSDLAANTGGSPKRERKKSSGVGGMEKCGTISGASVAGPLSVVWMLGLLLLPFLPLVAGVGNAHAAQADEKGKRSLGSLTSPESPVSEVTPSWGGRYLFEAILIGEYRSLRQALHSIPKEAKELRAELEPKWTETLLDNARIATHSARRWRPLRPLLSDAEQKELLNAGAGPSRTPPNGAGLRPDVLQTLTTETACPAPKAGPGLICGLERDIKSGMIPEVRRRWIGVLGAAVLDGFASTGGSANGSGANGSDANSSGSGDVAVKKDSAASLAALYLEDGNYPESLRVLARLQKAWPEYRWAYDRVQRIYSMRQKGAGRVAIRGM